MKILERASKEIEQKLNRIEENEKELNILLAEKKSHEKILETINFMEEKEKDILTRICINCEPIDTVAITYNVTPRQIYNWKKKALKSLLRRLYGDVNES